MMCARATRAHCLDGDLFLGSVEHSKKSKWTGQRRREIAGARMAALLLFRTRPRTRGGGRLRASAKVGDVDAVDAVDIMG